MFKLSLVVGHYKMIFLSIFECFNCKYSKGLKEFWKDVHKMATTKEMLEDAKLAENYITNSNLSNDYKKTYLKLLNITTMATNGISPEEKIQKMTEAIQLMAVAQGLYMAELDDKINSSIKQANEKQCKNCVAMEHAISFEAKRKEEEKFKKYLEALGIDPNNPRKPKPVTPPIKEKSWNEVIKDVLSKPYVYVVACLMVISPYGVEIIKILMQLWSK